MNRFVEINGLKLPSTLTTLLECGAWRTPTQRDAWRSIVPGGSAEEANLYDLRLMRTENANWLTLSKRFPAYLGQPDGQHLPGDIDPERSLLIGDLGPDRMIALDFRASQNHPSVVYITDIPDGSTRWIKIAADIESFAKSLRLPSLES